VIETNLLVEYMNRMYANKKTLFTIVGYPMNKKIVLSN
jgi:hypothetical protein